MGWFEDLFPVLLGEAEIRVLPPANARTLNVSFIVKTIALAKKNEFAEAAIAGLSGEPLQFLRGRPRTLSAVLTFDGRDSNTDVRQPMRRVAELMDVDPAMHAPPILSFDWRGESFQCVLESAVEEFRTLFADGRPSRGRMHVVFRESLTIEQLLRDAARE